MVAVFAGCVHQRNFSGSCSFPESEVANWHESAVEAVNSPDEWKRFGLVRLPQEEYKLDGALFDYNLNCSTPGLVEVTIRFPFKYYQPQVTLTITLSRALGLVHSMSEKVSPPMSEKKSTEHTDQ